MVQGSFLLRSLLVVALSVAVPFVANSQPYRGTIKGCFCLKTGQPAVKIKGKFYRLSTAEKAIRSLLPRQRTAAYKQLNSCKKAKPTKICPRLTPTPTPTRSGRDGTQPTPTPAPIQFGQTSFQGVEGQEVSLLSLFANPADINRAEVSIISQPSLGKLVVEQSNGRLENLRWSVGHHPGEVYTSELLVRAPGIDQNVIVSLTSLEGGNFSGRSGSLDSYSTDQGTLSLLEARRFAAHALLGASDGIVQALQQPGGLKRVVHNLLYDLPIEGYSCTQSSVEIGARLAAEVRMAGQCTGDGNQLCLRKAIDRNQGIAGELWSAESITYYLTHRLVNDCNPLKARMALFWMDHFNVSSESCNAAFECDTKLLPHFQSYFNQPWNFDTLLKTMNSDLLMLKYLNNDQNAVIWNQGRDTTTKANENYAREIMELFSLGTVPVLNPKSGPNYTDTDVATMSNALAGWQTLISGTRNFHVYSCDCTQNSVDPKICTSCGSGKGVIVDRGMLQVPYQSAVFRDRNWMPGPQNSIQLSPITLFPGRSFEATSYFRSSSIKDRTEVPDEYIKDSVSDFLLSHPEAAKFIAARIYSTFLKSTFNPQDVSNIESLASIIKQNGISDIRPILEKILTSEGMFSKTTQGVRSPIESLTVFIRALQFPLFYNKVNGQNIMDSYDQYMRLTRLMFQEPGRPLSVFGSAVRGSIQGGYPQNGARSLAMAPLLARYNSVNYFANWTDSVKNQVGFSWSSLLPPGNARNNPGLVVESLATKLGIELNDTQKAILIKYLSEVKVGPRNSPQALSWDPNNTGIVELKIPGLLMILFSMSDFVVV